VAIYWDHYFTTVSDSVVTMNQFITELVTVTYMDGLSQYGVGRGSFQGAVVISTINFPTPNSQHPGVTFSEDDMQRQLIAWLDMGIVTPQPAGNETSLVYLIFAPSDTALSLGGSTSGFCGYHQHAKRNANGPDDNLFWAIVRGYAQAPSGQNFVDSISYCVSHELVETFTNRDGNGYFSGNGCEISDLCEAGGSQQIFTVPFGRWQVEKYWSQVNGACIGPGLEPEISFSTSLLRFGTVIVGGGGESATETLRIRNVGQLDLSVTIPEPPPRPFPFWWTRLDVVIPPGGRKDVQIEFAPTQRQIGDNEGRMVVQGNTPESPTSTELRGTAKKGIVP